MDQLTGLSVWGADLLTDYNRTKSSDVKLHPAASTPIMAGLAGELDTETADIHHLEAPACSEILTDC